MHRLLQDALAESPVFARRDHRDLIGAIDAAIRRGELVAPLPGVYAARETATDWRTLAAAAARWDPDAIIVGEAAAALTFWPERVPRHVVVAVPRRQSTNPLVRSTRRLIPPELTLTRGGLTVASPELTAVDLASQTNGDAIDRALRSRTVTLAGLYRALELTPCRKGNRDRRVLLLDSRAEPWSGLERLAHRHMRDAGITRWRANVPIVVDGITYFQDVAMTDCPVSAELDGKIHLRPDIFEANRIRGNHLLLAGREVLHFTWAMVQDGHFVPTLLRAIRRHGVLGR